MMVGRKLEDQYPHLDKAPGDIRLKVDNLCGPGVNDVSFTLRKGEILGVSGLMGAGRTELMKEHVADSAALLQPRWRQFEACR